MLWLTSKKVATSARVSRTYQRSDRHRSGHRWKIAGDAPGTQAGRGGASSGHHQPLMQHQIRVFRMFFQISRNGRADHINFYAVFARPLQRGFGELRSQSVAPQRRRNFTMDKLQYFARKVVLKIGDLAVALNLKAAIGNLLRFQFFSAKHTTCSCFAAYAPNELGILGLYAINNQRSSAQSAAILGLCVSLCAPMNNVYSKMFWLVLGSQGEAGKVFKDPLVFQSVIYDFDQLSC